MNITLPIQSENYYKAYIQAISPILNITKTAQNIIITILEYNLDNLTKENRKLLCKLLGKSSYVVNNYVSGLYKKKFLIKQDNKVILNPVFRSNLEMKQITIKFKID